MKLVLASVPHLSHSRVNDLPLEAVMKTEEARTVEAHLPDWQAGGIISVCVEAIVSPT